MQIQIDKKEELSSKANFKNLDNDTKIKLLLALINDEGIYKLEPAMNKLVNRLFEMFDDYHEVIKNYLIKSICNIPLKASIYAYLISRLYSLHPNEDVMAAFINDIFSQLIEQLQMDSSCNANEGIGKCIRIFRFFFECPKYKLIPLESITSFISKIINWRNNINNYFKSELSFGNEVSLLHLILLNIHFLGGLAEFADAYAGIMKSIDKYFQTQYDAKMGRLAKYFDMNLSTGNNDRLIREWNVIYQSYLEGSKDKDFMVLSFPLDGITKVPSAVMNPFEKVISLNFSQLIFTDDVFSEMELSKDISLLQTISKYQRLILKFHIEDIISAFENNIDLCMNYLRIIPLFFGLDIIGGKETDGNQFSGIVDCCAIDTLMSLLLKPCQRNTKIVYYSSLSMHLSMKNKTNERLLTEYAQLCIKNLYRFNPECIENFSNWVTFYISNLGLNFMLSSLINKSLFEINECKYSYAVKMIIEKLINLGTKDKVSKMVKDNYLLESFFNVPETANWKFSPNDQFYYDTEVINDNIQNKKEYSSWKDQFESTGNEFIYVLSSCLFYSRSKTLSHLRESLMFYKDALVTNVDSKERQYVMLSALFDIWEHSSSYIKFVIEILLNNFILDHSTLVKYIVNEKLSQSKKNILNYLFYELIELANSNCISLIKRLKIELAKEQQNLARSDEKAQLGIINLIENYENNLEKLQATAAAIHVDIFMKLMQLVEGCNRLGGDNYEQLVMFLFQRIVDFAQKYRGSLKSVEKGSKNEMLEELINFIHY